MTIVYKQNIKLDVAEVCLVMYYKDQKQVHGSKPFGCFSMTFQDLGLIP